MKPELIQTLDRTIDINGVTHAVKVYISTVLDQDYDPSDQYFENEKQKNEHLKKFETGQLYSVGVLVRSVLAGEEGLDSLWGIEVNKTSNITDTINDYNMVNNSLIELKNNLLSSFNTLNKLFGVAL